MIVLSTYFSLAEQFIETFRGPMAPTIRDVARLAKVSPSTVSAVINNKGYISQVTLKRVNAAISKLDYTPQRSARDLAKRTSGNLGFIVSDTHFSRAEPFYTRVLFMGSVHYYDNI